MDRLLPGLLTSPREQAYADALTHVCKLPETPQGLETRLQLAKHAGLDKIAAVIADRRHGLHLRCKAVNALGNLSAHPVLAAWLAHHEYSPSTVDESHREYCKCCGGGGRSSTSSDVGGSGSPAGAWEASFVGEAATLPGGAEKSSLLPTHQQPCHLRGSAVPLLLDFLASTPDSMYALSDAAFALGWLVPHLPAEPLHGILAAMDGLLSLSLQRAVSLFQSPVSSADKELAKNTATFVLVLSLNIFRRLQALNIELLTATSSSTAPLPPPPHTDAPTGRTPPSQTVPAPAPAPTPTCHPIPHPPPPLSAPTLISCYLFSSAFMQSIPPCLALPDRLVQQLAVRLIRHLASVPAGKSGLLSARVLPPLLQVRSKAGSSGGDAGMLAEMDDAVARLLSP